jgi:ADP-ribose pyrophosphatase YjhB (NUDIX family)
VTVRSGCAGAIVFDGDGRLLLIERANPPAAGSWSLPGGRCEPGETAREACVREVAEETGLSVVVERPAGRVERDGPPGVVYDIEDFVCSVVGGVLTAGDDAAQARWVTREEFDTLPLAPLLGATLRDWGCLPRV